MTERLDSELRGRLRKEETVALEIVDGWLKELPTGVDPSELQGAVDTTFAAYIAANPGISRSLEAVTAVSTANLALTGAYSVDGRTMANGDRYLARVQTNAAQNGIYIYNSAGAHTRATDMDAAAEFVGARVSVTGGNTLVGNTYQCQSVVTTVGTSPVTIALIESQTSALVAEAAARIAGDQINIPMPNSGYINSIGVFVFSDSWAGTDRLDLRAIKISSLSIVGSVGSPVIAYYSANGAYLSGVFVTANGERVETVPTPPVLAQYAIVSSSKVGTWYIKGQNKTVDIDAIEKYTDDSLAGDLVTEGLGSDGSTTTASGSLMIMQNYPIYTSGIMKSIFFYTSASGSVTLYLLSKNASNQVTGIRSIPVAAVAGLNVVAVNFAVEAGQYIGVFAANPILRYVATGGLGVRYSSGVPSTDTTTNLIGSWTLSLGWTIQTGVIPRIDDLEEKVAQISSVEVSQALVYAARKSLSSPLSSASIIAIAFYGQSNSVPVYQGATPSAVLSGTQPYSNVMYSGGSLLPLVSVTNEKPFVTAANYATATRLKRGSGIPSTQVLAAFTAGVGGASISAIQRGSSGYVAFLARLNEIKALQPSVQLIVNFIQGETDTENNMLGTTYKNHLLTLQSNLEEDVNASTGRSDPLYFLVTQPAFKVALWKEVVLAQLEVCMTNDKFFMVSPMYRLPYSSVDSVHLTNVGYKLMGTYFGSANDAIMDGFEPRQFTPKSATFSGSKIELRMDVPVLPMMFDTSIGAVASNGFRVTEGGTTKTISGMEIQDDKVILTCASVLSGTVKIRYGLDFNGAGMNIVNGAAGNLRDSGPELVTISGTVFQRYNMAPSFELTAYTTNV
jgi:hypothetical protein